ncbi:MAG: hypothetical protein ACE364_05370 [Chlorobiota bacterium]
MIKSILIIYIFLTSISIVYSNENINDSLRKELKIEVRKDIQASLLINLFYDNIVNNKSSLSDVDDILLDYEQQYLLYLDFTNDTLTFYDKKFTLVKYSFDFESSSTQSIWDDSTKVPEEKVGFEELTSYVSHTLNMLNYNDIHKLHKNGLYLLSLDKNLFTKINIESDCLFLVDTLTNQSIVKDIQLKYYHYLPKKIKIEISDSYFSFYSEMLNRYFSGRIVYNSNYGYIMYLANGVLK